jgi:hypothetical protein
MTNYIHDLAYCCKLVASHGDDNVGRDPKDIATYLRIISTTAYREGEYELSARLATAATAINEDARNNHMPDWTRAEQILKGQSR